MTTLLILVALIAVVFAFVLAHRVEKLTASEAALRADRDHWHAHSKMAAARVSNLQEDLHAARTECIELEAVIANQRQRNSERGRKAAATRRARRVHIGTADLQAQLGASTGEVTGEVAAEVAPTLTTDAEGAE